MFRSDRKITLLLFLVTAGAVAARADIGPVAKPAVRHLDVLYERRGDAGVLDELIATAQRQLQTDVDNYDVTWRLARAWSWRGYVAADRAEGRVAAEHALELGRQAMTLAPGRVEGYFTYAIASGVYANAIGVAQAFVRRVGPDFERAMTRAYELDKHFDDGSPMVALGRYYYELPWPLRDLAQSARLLEEATASHPQSMRGHLYLAETYYALDRRREARRALDTVLSTASSDAGAAAMIQTARARRHEWFGTPLVKVASDEQ